MNKCYLGLGSNQKNPERQIRRAIQNIRNIPFTTVTQVSGLHWSKAWGLQRQQDFCNVVVEIKTRLSPLILLNRCQDIESQQGRVRKKRWGPRTLDVDIILYNQQQINNHRLAIPHPHYQERDFVLKPLAELNTELTFSKNACARFSTTL